MFRPSAETDSATLYRDKDKGETNNEFISRWAVRYLQRRNLSDFFAIRLLVGSDTTKSRK